MTIRRTRRPTIVDIAARVGVSKSLVSLALRGDEGVSDATRARIVQAADELGYRSNSLARALVRGRTGQIGVLVTDLRNPYHTEVALGVETAAEAVGLETFLANGRRDPNRMAAHLNAMLGLNMEGIVVVSSRVEYAVLAAAAKETPVVVVGRPEDTPPGLDSVANEDEAGIGLAVDHLIGLGHRHIAFASASRRPAALARRRGYEAALRRAGLEPLDARPVPLGAGRTEAIDAILRGRATAVVTNNDLLAVDVLDRAFDLGVDVPGRISVVGYDNTDLAARVRPRLTSVDQCGPALGETAVALLLERVAGRDADRHEVLFPNLEVRDSTASPAF
ncbi:LacI family DNA-binding transcriptional regulator [Nocardia puris]|uniref:LacI family transcriptional regulator n=1 Tax=Nocardia puris TaxID=208602 RepID=A0A366D8Z5_9NOCA|nr:LacI family DNA-binding transcriptional regulator [Nocardia puris]MBF6214000.1 LacI family DNA-binding transcriptional regulator [Nocardia puris]MBF6368703.1 LacI family DNA-binding transcriptional regulator [Nocardia puris]MBF6461618.1 LacI family DNA-binding transcriptional regulator [Nocardia puris]RBO86510.1 LacI family transcriptional regulator [Nocardia puris]